jgi:hypothetical protein
MVDVTRRQFLQGVSAMMVLAGTPIKTAERVANAICDESLGESVAGPASALMTMQTERQSFPLMDLFVDIERPTYDFTEHGHTMFQPGFTEASVTFKALLKDCDPSRLPITCEEDVRIEVLDQRFAWEFKGLCILVDVHHADAAEMSLAVADARLMPTEVMNVENIVEAEMAVMGPITFEERSP